MEEQLALVKCIQELRGPFLDAIFRGLNFFDSGIYYSSLNTFIWVALSWRWGARIGYLLIANGMINSLMKTAFAMPRPFFLDTSVGLVKAASFGFPSGGAQTALLLGALLIWGWKSRWAWLCAICYALLISFSRLYLGVHFPIDVLGGWALGLLLFAAFAGCGGAIEKFAAAKPESAIHGALALFLALIVLLPHKLHYLCIVAIVITLGIYLSTRYKLYLGDVRGIAKRLCHAAIALAGAVLIGLGVIKLAPPGFQDAFAVSSFFGAVWISLAVSPFCKRVCP